MYQEAFRSGPVITKVLTEICLELIRKRTKNLRTVGGPARESQLEPQRHETTVLQPHIAMGYSEGGHSEQILGNILFSQAKLYQHYTAYGPLFFMCLVYLKQAKNTCFRWLISVSRRLLLC
jgi:hypothetical protein